MGRPKLAKYGQIGILIQEHMTSCSKTLHLVLLSKATCHLVDERTSLRIWPAWDTLLSRCLQKIQPKSN